MVILSPRLVGSMVWKRAGCDAFHPEFTLCFSARQCFAVTFFQACGWKAWEKTEILCHTWPSKGHNLCIFSWNPRSESAGLFCNYSCIHIGMPCDDFNASDFAVGVSCCSWAQFTLEKVRIDMFWGKGQWFIAILKLGLLWVYLEDKPTDDQW